MNINDLAFQATAFEKWGMIDYEDFKTYILMETLLEEDEDTIIEVYQLRTQNQLIELEK